MAVASPEKRRLIHREYMRKRYASDPLHRLKHKARVAAYKAIRIGKVTRQPCESCGSESAQMHHDDYSRPLDIKWLCRRCHERQHGSANFGGGPK